MRSDRTVAWLAALFLVSACKDEAQTPTPRDAGTARDAGSAPRDAGVLEITEACVPPQTTPVFGDANGDGVMNIADAIAIANTRYRGGTEPACFAASDYNDDGRIEADDGTRITTYLVTGNQEFRRLGANDCSSVAPWPQPACVPLAFSVESEERVSEGTFEAKIAIANPSRPVQGWSASIGATGCTIDRISTDGTIAAEIWDRPPGVRESGYAANATVDLGAISYVVLSFAEDVVLPPSATPVPVLTVELSATVPDADCQPCRLSVGGGLSWTGPAIDAVIVSAGYGYQPAPVSHTIPVCAP